MDEENNIYENDILSKGFALCPLDGRYSKIRDKLAPYFSEFALIKNRVKIEIFWLKFLLDKNINNIKIQNKIDSDSISRIISIYNDFSIDSFKEFKEIEEITKHDVKAVEIYIANKLKEFGFETLISYVHIGCTSEDINNVAYATMIKSGIYEVWEPVAKELITILKDMAYKYSEIPMLSHTHGQPATPTTVGKELGVYIYRMKQSLIHLESIQTKAKFNGATGNYSAISIAFPNEDWQALSKRFIEDYLGLTFNPVTTQIESHDYICHIADAIRHFNNIILDFDVDMWLYISREYFKQIPVKTEVGSSTMPHKVNPINFENSESNIDMSNSIFMALSNKLPRSRMQRDLSDSSSQRNIGIAFGYSIQAIEQTITGIKKISVNTAKILGELDNMWFILAEPIQTVLRKYNVPNAYDQLKELTRGKEITKKIIHDFILNLDVLSEEDKNILLELTPSKYVGLATKIIKDEI